MAETADDNSKSHLWFLNPDLGRLASRELTFVTEWTRSGETAKKFLRHALTDRTIRWHAEITDEMLDSPTIRAGHPFAMVDPEYSMSIVAIRRGLWADHDRPVIDWEASCAVYLGPLIRLGCAPNNPNDNWPIFDPRAVVRITVDFLRFHHGDVMRELRARGLMPRAAVSSPSVSAAAPAPAPSSPVPPPKKWNRPRRERLLRDKIKLHPLPPEPRQKAKWCEARFKEIEKEFTANCPWSKPDSLRRSLDKMLSADAKTSTKTR